MNITFFGVRGSTPTCTAENVRYGGNTSCVVIEHRGCPPLILDLGSGLPIYGRTLGDSDFSGVALLSHLHWDHFQGLPFFGPLLRGGHLAIHSPSPECGLSLEQAVDKAIQPPYFPVGLRDFQGTVTFDEIDGRPMQFGDACVRSAPVRHTGPTCGFRIEIGGRSVAYIPDHQQPADAPTSVDPEVLSLCRDVDVLIHDAQYTQAEFETKSDWGHCTMEYAVEVGDQAGASTVVLFHHDPSHTDDFLNDEVDRLRATSRTGLEIMAAQEGLSIDLS